MGQQYFIFYDLMVLTDIIGAFLLCYSVVPFFFLALLVDVSGFLWSEHVM